MDFTLGIIMRNETNTLPKLAESIKNFTGERIALDTGSSDNSIEIAKSLGFKVHESGDTHWHRITEEQAKTINDETLELDGKKIVEAGETCFDFSSARNALSELCHNDWIFQPDCDELVKMDVEKLKAAMTDKVDSLSHWITAGDQKWQTVRVYNKKKTKWTGIVHNSVGRKWAEIGEDVLSMNHAWQEKKDDRTKRITGLALGVLLQPEDARRLFYYGRHLLWQGFPNTAIKVLHKAARLHWWKPEKAQCHIFAGDAFHALGKESEMINEYEQAAKIDPTRRVGLLRLMNYYKEKKDWEKVVKYAGEAKKIKRSSGYIENISDFGSLAAIWHYVALHRLNRIGEARVAYGEAIEAFSTDHNIINDWQYFYPYPQVSIVVPTLGRPEKLARLLKLIGQNADWPNYEILVQHDSFEKRKGVPVNFKEGVDRSAGEYVMFLANDCLPQPGFLFQAMKRMFLAFPNADGLVSINDGVWNGDPATHWLASKKLLPFLDGEFFNTIYFHTKCDVELTERCKLMGKFVYEPLSKLIHENPIVKGGEMDEVNKIAANMDRRRRDCATYEKRKAIWSKPVKTELCLLAEKYKSDKCPSIFHGYTPKYHELLNPIRDKVSKVLEIGIGTPKTMSHVKDYKAGASLFMWRDYFLNADIYAIDVKKEALVNEPRISSVICDQSKPDELEHMAVGFDSNFDLIIDDGSHKPEHQIISAKTLIRHLASDGLYIIEDIADPQPLLDAFASEPWTVELFNFNLEFSKWDRMIVIRKKNPLDLPFTGERVVPDKMDRQPQTLAEHLARYSFAKKHIFGLVLDAPCGTGYGSNMLNAVGCDISKEAINYALAKYPHLMFYEADLETLKGLETPGFVGTPFTVVSFEGIEHLSDPNPFINWVRTHANQFIFSIPVNNPSRFHKQVYSVEQIKELMFGFKSVKWFSQTGTVIKPLEEGEKPVFIVGVAET